MDMEEMYTWKVEQYTNEEILSKHAHIHFHLSTFCACVVLWVRLFQPIAIAAAQDGS